jgi:hypothetical protein
MQMCGFYCDKQGELLKILGIIFNGHDINADEFLINGYPQTKNADAFQNICTSIICISAHLQLNLFVFTREKMKLRDLVSGITFHLYPLVVFKIPFPLAADKALFDVGLNVGMNDERDTLFVLFNQDEVEVGLDIVDQ